MSHTTLGLLFGVALAMCTAHAQSEPLAGTEILPNGMRLVVRERHRLPVVALDLWVRAGSADERIGENGCAHFLEHTLFKGTETHKAGAADYRVESLGGELNASTGADYAHYYTELPSAHVVDAISVIADIVRRATFPDAEIERERYVILNELARHNADPMSRLQDRLYRKALFDGPYAYSPGGEPSSIAIRGRDTLVAFYQRLYIPSRCTLALAGDITPAKAREVAMAAFGDWKGSEAIGSPTVRVPAPQPDSTKLETQRGREAVGLAFPAPAARRGKLACIAQVCAALLGASGQGGEFGTEVWNGTEINVRYFPRRELSLMTITAALPAPVPPRPFEPAPALQFANINAIETAIRAAIGELSTIPRSNIALRSAIETVRGHLLYDMETDAGLAHAIGLADLLGAETPEQQLVTLDTVTASDVMAYAAEWLVPRSAVALYSHAVRREE